MFTIKDSLYSDYRIPAMAVSKGGSLYVACECREDHSDWANIDLQMWKSVDGGQSFVEILTILGNGNTMNNPVLIVKEEMVHFLYCENYRRVFHIKSTDGGKTWSKAQEITEIFEKHPHTVVAVGPGHGVVTKEGNLLSPVWLANNPDDPFAHKPSYITTIYSEDDGETWKCGEAITHPELYSGNETAVALTKDKKVLLSVRNIHPEIRMRYWVKSETGYDQWEHMGYDERFIDPKCMGSMCSSEQGIFFSNCESTQVREHLTVKMSTDDFETFERIYISENASYSEVSIWKNQLYVLYETYEIIGDERKNHRLHLKVIEVAK